MSVSAVITAAGQNRRMREDLKKRKLPLKNKLLLEIKGKTVLEHTLDRVLNAKVQECVVVLGHFKDEIIPTLNHIPDPRLKVVENNPVQVPLAQSLWEGLKATSHKICLCLAGDQPTITTTQLDKMIKKVHMSKNQDKIVSILGRNGSGYLDSAEGLGMPFASSKNLLLNYLPHYKSNLNPMLKRMIKDGVAFYGFPTENKLELININYYKDYEYILKNFK